MGGLVIVINANVASIFVTIDSMPQNETVGTRLDCVAIAIKIRQIEKKLEYVRKDLPVLVVIAGYLMSKVWAVLRKYRERVV